LYDLPELDNTVEGMLPYLQSPLTGWEPLAVEEDVASGILPNMDQGPCNGYLATALGLISKSTLVTLKIPRTVAPYLTRTILIGNRLMWRARNKANKVSDDEEEENDEADEIRQAERDMWDSQARQDKIMLQASRFRDRVSTKHIVKEFWTHRRVEPFTRKRQRTIIDMGLTDLRTHTSGTERGKRVREQYKVQIDMEKLKRAPEQDYVPKKKQNPLPRVTQPWNCFQCGEFSDPKGERKIAKRHPNYPDLAICIECELVHKEGKYRPDEAEIDIFCRVCGTSDAARPEVPEVDKVLITCNRQECGWGVCRTCLVRHTRRSQVDPDTFDACIKCDKVPLHPVAMGYSFNAEQETNWDNYIIDQECYECEGDLRRESNAHKCSRLECGKAWHHACLPKHYRTGYKTSPRNWVCFSRECRPLISQIEEQRIAQGLPPRPPLPTREAHHLEDPTREHSLRKRLVQSTTDPRKPKRLRLVINNTRIPNPIQIESMPMDKEQRKDTTRPPRVLTGKTVTRYRMTLHVLIAAMTSMFTQNTDDDDKSEASHTDPDEPNDAPEDNQNTFNHRHRHMTLRRKRKSPETPPDGWG
jgi:hypothetical protein